MNGAVLDTTFNFFFKFKYAHTFDAMLATPLRVRDVAYGEMTWALLRGALYSAAFLVTMAIVGLVHSWWALLAVPAGLLIAAAFAGAGIGGTTFMRSWIDFDFVNLALIPMFLFSGVFFPLSQYPDAVQVDRAGHAAVPGRRARAGAHPRPRRVDPAPQRALPRRHGLARPPRRHPPPHPHAPALTHPTNWRQ